MNAHDETRSSTASLHLPRHSVLPPRRPKARTGQPCLVDVPPASRKAGGTPAPQIKSTHRLIAMAMLGALLHAPAVQENLKGQLPRSVSAFHR